jgi:hypothetical protein
MAEKQVRRKVRRVKRESVSVDDMNDALREWGAVIRVVVDMDPREIHSELEAELGRPANTGMVLIGLLDEAPTRYYEACRLANRARRDYELFKVRHAEWMDKKKNAARLALEEEKKAGKLSKQITKDMIEDAVRQTWPGEYREHQEDYRGFQAAVHQMESLAEAWKRRITTLSHQKDLVLAYGASAKGN